MNPAPHRKPAKVVVRAACYNSNYAPGKFVYEVVGGNGQVLTESAKQYSSVKAARKGVECLRAAIFAAPVIYDREAGE